MLNRKQQASPNSSHNSSASPTSKDLEVEVKEQHRAFIMASEILGHCSLVLAHALVIGLLAFITYISPPGAGDKPVFSLHPFFSTLGFIGLATEAILVFNPSQAKTCNVSKLWKTRLHLWIQIAASISLAIGLAGIYIHRENNNKQHFKPWHGLIGFIALVVMWTQTTISLVLLLPGRLFAATPLPMHRLKTLHTVLGISSYLLMSVGFLLSFTTKFFGHQTANNDLAHYTCWISSVLLTVIVFAQAAGSSIKRFRYWSSPSTSNRRTSNLNSPNDGLQLLDR